MPKLWKAAAGVTGFIAFTYGLVALKAPHSTGSGARVEDLVAKLRATDLAGKSLVDEAIAQVAHAMPYHSAWHLWENPENALRHGRGWAHQCNTVLLLVLRDLGFDAKLVHAARVRGFQFPWFLSGHTWVKVNIDGAWLDACASSSQNRAGEINFVPLTAELPMFVRTRFAVGLALSPFVVVEVWKSWLTGSPLPTWVFGRRDATS